MEEGYSHKTKFENSIMPERFARLYKRFVNNYEIKKFPIIIKAYSSEKFYIPWELIAPHEGQAQENHGQDLKTLAYRGGLAWDEAYAVLTNIKYPSREEYISMEYYKEKVEKMCWKWIERQESMGFERCLSKLSKAKRTDSGEWVEGYYFEFSGHSYITDMDRSFLEAYYIQPSAVDFHLRAYEVEPSTICQCTGLCDKNSNLIWENDIVITPANDCCTVVWDAHGMWTMMVNIDEDYNFYAFPPEEIEIIRNKFEPQEDCEKKLKCYSNLKLLNGEKK